MTRDPIPCGSIAAYRRHQYRGEPVDDQCRQAYNDYQRAYQKAQRPEPVIQPCGTPAAYARHMARREPPCQECRVTYSIYRGHTPLKLSPCGTYGAYQRHLRNHEPVCEECARAGSEYRKLHPSKVRYPRRPAEPRISAPPTQRLAGEVLGVRAAQLAAAGLRLSQIAAQLEVSAMAARGAVQEGRRILTARRQTAGVR